MSKPLVPDELWEVVAPLIPPEPPKPKGGRPRVPDRACLTGIVFVLRTGLPWEYLPREMGCGSGMTCWRRLRAWERAGVWHRLHQVLLERLEGAGQIDWSRASLDSATIPAKRGAPRPGRTRPTGASPAPSATSWWTATASHRRST
jgi:transposase